MVKGSTIGCEHGEKGHGCLPRDDDRRRVGRIGRAGCDGWLRSLAGASRPGEPDQRSRCVQPDDARPARWSAAHGGRPVGRPRRRSSAHDHRLPRRQRHPDGQQRRRCGRHSYGERRGAATRVVSGDRQSAVPDRDGSGGRQRSAAARTRLLADADGARARHLVGEHAAFARDEMGASAQSGRREPQPCTGDGHGDEFVRSPQSADRCLRPGVRPYARGGWRPREPRSSMACAR